MFAACGCVFAQPDSRGPLLLREPSVSSTQIAFSYAGNIWIARRDGSGLHRLTNGGHDTRPAISPDGSTVAFAGEAGGYRAVYVVSVNGGQPRQLTFHPADLGSEGLGPIPDFVGWTPDGTQVLFNSRRTSFAWWGSQLIAVQMFKVPADGGFAVRVPLERATQGAFSPDGTRMAYVPNSQWEPDWKHYRGGQTTPIWIVNLADSSIEARIPRDNSNDFNPMWIGETIYFLSDRDGPVSLYAYDLRSHSVRRVIENHGLDIKSASAGPDAIVYEQFGSLRLFDPKKRDNRILDFRPPPAKVPERDWNVDPSQVRLADLSPDGRAAAFGVRGEILTADLRSGAVHNLTQTTGTVERDPAWSPDGAWIAYFTDESGDYALNVRAADGTRAPRRIALTQKPSFPYTPVWSPDSKKIGFTDKQLNCRYIDLETREETLIDTDLHIDPAHRMQLAWSPDSRSIAYTRQLPSHLHAVFVYSLPKRRSQQVTDGRGDALYISFDKSGRFLYFTVSTDVGLSVGANDMTSLQRPVTRRVYSVAMNEDTDLISAAPVALPVPARNYYGIAAGKHETLFLIEGPAWDPLPEAHSDDLSEISTNLIAFNTATGESRTLLTGVAYFYDKLISSWHLSADSTHMLYASGGQWFTSPAGGAALVQTQLDLATARIHIAPRAEWAHMFEQVWRDEREFFYDPAMHGVDLKHIRERYQPFLRNLASRADLTYLFREMLGNLSVSHLWVTGTDPVESQDSRIGLLGADYTVADGRYRFERIFPGDRWDPNNRGPLAQPGVNIETGDYLLGVDGREVRPTADVFSFFTSTAGKPTNITVSSSADGSSAREVTVVPTRHEGALRSAAWVEHNRRRVDDLSGGRVAYIYLPDTYAEGYSSFNREYVSQIGKDAVIVDARYNGGGLFADYIIEYLRRPLLGYWNFRDGQDLPAPGMGIFGPKVLIVNEMTGSGGDALAWMFRRTGLGPLIGKRTWGGLVGTYLTPDDLLDGGLLMTPDMAFYTADGAWEIENHGVAPDVEVDSDPKAERDGHDLQIEKAVATALDLLHTRPSTPAPQHPPYPTYYFGVPE